MPHHDVLFELYYANRDDLPHLLVVVPPVGGLSLYPSRPPLSDVGLGELRQGEGREPTRGLPMTNTPAPLDKIRSQIDLLDVDLVHLLAAREHLVRQAGRLKTDTIAVRAPTRVERVVAKARATAAEAGATPDIVERIYRVMITAFVDLELKHHAQGADPTPPCPR